MTAVIRIQAVSFGYVEGPKVLERVTLDVEPGEFLGLVGPNGGGKSTLLKLILGLLQPSAGAISILGQPPKVGRKQIGYVPQHAVFARDFPISVRDAVRLARLGRRTFGRYTPQDKQAAERALVEAEIVDLADRPVGTLSGGQLQRVLLARALASEPEILLLDEPTANIDLRVERDIFDLLKALNARMTIVVVSHDIAFISGYVTHVACLNRTLVCHRTEAITQDVIATLYGGDVRMIRHYH